MACLISILFNLTYGFEIKRVILATDNNPMYLEFWHIVAPVWKQLVGVTPTLAFIAPKGTPIDTSIGDVIYFEPIKGVPTSFTAQTIRLLLPALFGNDGCIIADIDLIPLQRDYFVDSVKKIKDDSFVVFRNREYSGSSYPMCYNAACGKVFADIFHVSTLEDVRTKIIEWYKLGLGWNTDENVLYKYLHAWNYFGEKCVLLGHKVEKRVDRENWKYSEKLVKKKFYIDSHLLRPYSQHKEKILRLIQSCDIKGSVLDN